MSSTGKIYKVHLEVKTHEVLQKSISSISAEILISFTALVVFTKLNSRTLKSMLPCQLMANQSTMDLIAGVL